MCKPLQPLERDTEKGERRAGYLLKVELTEGLWWCVYINIVAHIALMFDCINQTKKYIQLLARWSELTTVLLELYTIILGNVGNNLLKNCTRQVEEKG